MRQAGQRISAATAALLVMAAMLLAPPVAGPASASYDGLASRTSAAWTPWVRDGQVLAIAQVGGLVVLGGSFTSVSPPRSETVIPRTSIVAFDAATGALLESFAPQLDGAVHTLLPGPVAGTVYAGGAFKSVDGVARKSLVLLDISTGAPVTGWSSPYVNGLVTDLALVGQRLVVAGTFTKVGTNTRNGLASLEPTRGRFDPWMTVGVTENHNWTTGSTGARAAVGVENIDVTPDGATLVLIGNFRRVDGLERRQVALVDVTGAPTVRTDWQTSRFSASCSWKSFDSYVRDVDVSPDGSYFVVATTGGGHAGTLCDTASRWNLADTGTDVAPQWTMETGGDTLFSVATTGQAVYAGGHQRWANNPDGRDSARGGAVPRPGLVALDPDSGVPFSWNPGRNPRGIGTTALLATDAGLWAGSDTEWIGNFQWRRMRIAFFPADSQSSPPRAESWQLPANVFAGGGASQAADTLDRRHLVGTRTDWTDAVPGTGVDWTAVRGGFVVDGTLFHGAADGQLYRRGFDGSTVGPAELVDPYNDQAWSTVPTGSKSTVYRGAVPSLYGTELASVTGMTYLPNRIVYARTGSTTLHWRWFNPESGIVGQRRHDVAGAVPADVRGLFAADGYLWYAHGAGELSRQKVLGTALVPGSTELVGGPAVDGVDWRARALFPGPGPLPPANATPQATWTVSCAQLTCTFDASASTDPDGSITAYSWTLGDGTTRDGAVVEHSFAGPGEYPVRLVVTDSRAGTGTAARAVTVSTENLPPTPAWSMTCTDLDCRFDAGATTDVDGAVVDYAWDFGDGTSASGEVTEHSFRATGVYRVTLSVTDDAGAGAVETQDVSVTAAPQTIGFRAVRTAQTAGATATTVTVPPEVRPGDTMLLFATVNSTTAVTGPSGWTEVGRQVSGTMVTVVWSRVSSTGDAGSDVTVTLGSTARTDLQLVAYSGADTTSPVADVASTADVSTANHTTPVLTARERAAFVVSYWADKSSSTTSWQVPGAVVARASTTATGAGRVTSVVADSGSPVAAGAAEGGHTAVTDAVSSRGTTWTVVLRPAAG